MKTGFLSFLNKYLFKYIVDRSALSTETWMLPSRHHRWAQAPSALLRPVEEAGDRTRARWGLRLSFPARVPPTGSACLVRSAVLSPPHRCKTEAARDALRGRFLLVSIPLQFVRKAPQVTLNNNSLRLTRRLSLSEQYYTYFKKVFYFMKHTFQCYVSHLFYPNMKLLDKWLCDTGRGDR